MEINPKFLRNRLMRSEGKKKKSALIPSLPSVRVPWVDDYITLGSILALFFIFFFFFLHKPCFFNSADILKECISDLHIFWLNLLVKMAHEQWFFQCQLSGIWSTLTDLLSRLRNKCWWFKWVSSPLLLDKMVPWFCFHSIQMRD